MKDAAITTSVSDKGEVDLIVNTEEKESDKNETQNDPSVYLVSGSDC